MSRKRLIISALLAPLAPLLVLYALTLIMDGPTPVASREPYRVALMAIPGVLIAYPWAWIVGGPLAWLLRKRENNSYAIHALAGLLAGALPASIVAVSQQPMPIAAPAIIFGCCGAVAALAWRYLAGPVNQGLR